MCRDVSSTGEYISKTAQHHFTKSTVPCTVPPSDPVRGQKILYRCIPFRRTPQNLYRSIPFLRAQKKLYRHTVPELPQFPLAKRVDSRGYGIAVRYGVHVLFCSIDDAAASSRFERLSIDLLC